MMIDNRGQAQVLGSSLQYFRNKYPHTTAYVYVGFVGSMPIYSTPCTLSQCEGTKALWRLLYGDVPNTRLPYRLAIRAKKERQGNGR